MKSIIHIGCGFTDRAPKRREYTIFFLAVVPRTRYYYYFFDRFGAWFGTQTHTCKHADYIFSLLIIARRLLFTSLHLFIHIFFTLSHLKLHRDVELPNNPFTSDIFDLIGFDFGQTSIKTICLKLFIRVVQAASLPFEFSSKFENGMNRQENASTCDLVSA